MSDLGIPLWPILLKQGWRLPAPAPGWRTVRCHFHEDKQASCRVNNDLGAYACHACGEQGDVIDAVRYYYGKELTFVEALKIAQDITGVRDSDLPRAARPRGGRVSPRSRNRETNSTTLPSRRRSGTAGGGQ